MRSLEASLCCCGHNLMPPFCTDIKNISFTLHGVLVGVKTRDQVRNVEFVIENFVFFKNTPYNILQNTREDEIAFP